MFGQLHQRVPKANRVSPKEGAFRLPRSAISHKISQEFAPNSSHSSESLTAILLKSHADEFHAATTGSFLQQAGEGTLSKHDLSRWLSQDRLYAETYICFVTSLIARVTLPYEFVADKSKSLRWRIVHILTEALQNIHRELEFFTNTAHQYGLSLQEPYSETATEFLPVDATEAYMTLFKSFFSDPQQSLLEGLIVLWATEICYLRAWTNASRFQDKDAKAASDADGGALREAFIPNWTSNEFQKFVDDIAEVTNALAEREGGLKKIEIYKALWLHVLDIERRFWPDV